PLAQRHSLAAVNRNVLLQYDLADIGGVDWKPALGIDVYLGTAMLCFCDVAGLSERFRQFRVRYPDAEEVSRRQPRCSRQPDKKRIDIGALAAQITGFQHEQNVPKATAARLGAAEGVVDYPIIDRPSLVQRCGAGADDLARLG